MSKKKFEAALIAATLAVSPAFAADWQPYGNHPAEAPRAIYTQQDQGVATLLSCDADGQLSAIVSLKEGDFVQKMKANAPYRRSVEVSMIRDGVEEGKNLWILIAAVDMIHTNSHTDAAKIYNAAVQGKTVKLSVERKGSTSLDLPDVNDTFRAFSQTCFQSE